MEFKFTDEEQQFRSELRAFLASALPGWWQGMYIGGEKAWAFTVEFCRKLAERGWLTMAWPKEYGGQGASHWKQAVLREELRAVSEPRGPQYMNLNYIGPCIMLFGTEEQKRQHLLPMARGEIIWCQGFSEPNAGSDLASLQLKAEESGDEFVLNGQKIWTSYANRASWCFLLARTDASVSKHKGISLFLVDMKTPGITVRPIHGLTGYSEINEVFFDNVRVPRSALLGNKNEGWKIAMAGLAFERTGNARYHHAWIKLQRVIAYAQKTNRNGRPLSEDPVVRQMLAQTYVDYRVARMVNYRIVAMQEDGLIPTYETSIARIHTSTLEQKVADVGMQVAGFDGLLQPGGEEVPLRGDIELAWRTTNHTSVAVGATEIQKNIIAARGLGLPR